VSRAKRTRKKENARAAREARAAALRKQKRRKTAISLGIPLVVVLLIAIIVPFLVSGSDNKKKDAASSSSTTTTPTTVAAGANCTVPSGSAEQAKITTSEGEIDVALDTLSAPVASSHFVSIAKAGKYDGLKWHRAAKDFVIQGGDPKGDGSGGNDNTVVGELPQDSYPIGSIAAAKTGDAPAGTFGTQFFIVTGSRGATLPNDYARFGCVTSGIDVAKKIESYAPDSGDGTPTKTETIDKVEIVDGPPQTTTTAAPAPDASTTTAAAATTTTTGG
jgi:cyclophilin family peptidyl-prolyl cis-trans isomerase